MMPNCESGNSSLLMVILLLLSGTMMISGLSSFLDTQRKKGAQEVRAIGHYAGAESALAWGQQQQWQPDGRWQCLTESSGALRACLMRIQENEALLAGFLAGERAAERLILWRWGSVSRGRFIAAPRGWLDYCPLADQRGCYPGC